MDPLDPFQLTSYLKALYMTRQDRAQELIRRQVIWSMGAGLLPVPVVDVAAVTAIQLDLVKKLCELYKVEFDKGMGKGLVAALVGSSAAKVGSSALKLIPVVGGVLGGVSMVVLSGASTYATGQVIVRHFDDGGTLENLDTETARKLYEEFLVKGKELAQQIEEDIRTGRIKDVLAGDVSAYRDKPKSRKTAGSAAAAPAEDDVFAKLEKLSALKEKGILTEEEFQTQKQKLLRQL